MLLFMRYKLSAIGFNWQLIFWVWQRFVVPRPVGVCRGGCQQPKMGERRSKEVLRKNWLVAKTNQAKKNPPTSLWKFGLALAVENYPQSHLSQVRLLSAAADQPSEEPFLAQF